MSHGFWAVYPTLRHETSNDSGVRSHLICMMYACCLICMYHTFWAADTINSHMTTPGYVQYDQGTDHTFGAACPSELF